MDSPKALGYSTAGIVKASLDSNNYYKPGDRVACAGQDLASHSEVVSVPQNLVAKIPDNVSFDEAAFTTIGAIALQGVRQTEPQLGENICLIGLGLIGQITGQLLKASGANVFGIDLNSELVKLAENKACDISLLRNDSGLLAAAEQFTSGYGFDKVVITAATDSNDPIELSAEISRKKGKVILVGAVGMNVPRDPHFYRKELDLKMSCSYGPGRYDVNYEDLGNDYPIGYVRWTEQRNMEAFLGAISKGQVKLDYLMSHKFEIDDAHKAYDLVMNPDSDFSIGVLLKYPDRPNKYDPINLKARGNQQGNKQKPIVAFIGAGSFAQSYLIPHIGQAGGRLHTVITNRGINSEHVSSKFDFETASHESEEVMTSSEINTVFIATQHNTHAKYATEALLNGKNVFVEKPLAMNEEELKQVEIALNKSEGKLLVGFNRRFSQAAEAIKNQFGNTNDPLAFNFRINAGEIPQDHWTQIEELGGGRIIGEICHFVDLMAFFANSSVKAVYAQSLPSLGSEKKNDDNIVITLNFDNGSVGSINYFSNGDKSVPKEHLEVYGSGKSAIIHDFRNVTLHQNSSKKKVVCSGKGQKEEVELFIKSIQDGSPSPISIESIINTTRTTFKILDSLSTGLPQTIE